MPFPFMICLKDFRTFVCHVFVVRKKLWRWKSSGKWTHNLSGTWNSKLLHIYCAFYIRMSGKYTNYFTHYAVLTPIVNIVLSSRLLSKNLKIKIYSTIILPVVLYGCETWSLTLREERRLRVFENRVLRRVFGPKRDEVTGEWRKLHNEELRDLYSLPNIVRVVKSRRMRWAGHVARMGEGRDVHRVLVGKPEGKRPLGRPRRDDNIKMDLRELGGVETG